MHILRLEKIAPELTKYIVASDYHGAPAGFILLVKKSSDKNVFVRDGIIFKRSGGDTSNHFLQALSEIYGLKNTNTVFSDSLVVTYYDLEASIDTKNPSNWIAAQKKIFFETTDDNPELFMNIDEKAATISFPEKDSSYRAGIITALGKKTK